MPLWDLLLKSGVNPNIDENTKIRFIAADNYNFAPMTIKEIKDSSLYGYYEKSPLDKGDGAFNSISEKPLYSGLPVLVTYGFNGYPYVIRATDEGFNPGLGNEGGPLRIIFGKTNYSDTNGSHQVQFAKEIIVGEGESLSTNSHVTGGVTTGQEVSENSSFKHNEEIYKDYLDIPVLRITGSQVKEPVTLTLRQIEALTKYSVRDIYTGDGIREFEGVVLWDLISQVAGIKEGVDVPSIRVFSGPNYNQILRSTDQVINGVLNSQGKNKKIILAYGVDGYPLVPNEGSEGYINNNAYGPLRLIIEESKSMCVKWTDCIVVGTGEYEHPKLEDVKEINIPDISQIDKESITIKDIKNSWAKKEIENMAAMGYVEGYNGMFRPFDNITRAEFTTLIVKVLRIDLNDSVSVTLFKDVKSNDWYSKYIETAYNIGLIKGYEDGTFKPNAPITRQEIASIIGPLLNSNLSENDADEILSHFSDNVDDYANISAAKCVKAEIIKGLPNNLFAGSKNASRAEAAVMILRFLKN